MANDPVVEYAEMIDQYGKERVDFLRNAGIQLNDLRSSMGAVENDVHLATLRAAGVRYITGAASSLRKGVTVDQLLVCHHKGLTDMYGPGYIVGGEGSVGTFDDVVAFLDAGIKDLYDAAQAMRMRATREQVIKFRAAGLDKAYDGAWALSGNPVTDDDVIALHRAGITNLPHAAKTVGMVMHAGLAVDVEAAVKLAIDFHVAGIGQYDSFYAIRAMERGGTLKELSELNKQGVSSIDWLNAVEALREGATFKQALVDFRPKGEKTAKRRVNASRPPIYRDDPTDVPSVIR